MTTLPNKTLQATADVPCGWELAWRHNAVVAGASALPAAVPELLSLVVRRQHTMNRIAFIFRRHSLICFYIIACGITWGSVFLIEQFPSVFQRGILAQNLVPNGLPGGLWLVNLPVGYGPALAGLVLLIVCTGRPGIRAWLASWVRWRVGWKWYALALLSAPVLFVLQNLATRPAELFSRFFANPVPGVVRDCLLGFPLLIVPYFIYLAGEEGGWRGFALPRLQEHYGPVVGSCILGVLWEAWHLPFILRPGHAYYDLGTLSVSLFLLRATLMFNLFAIICTWIFNNTRGSLLPVLLWHASENAMADTERHLFNVTGKTLPGRAIGDWILWPVVAIIIIWLTRGRLGYDRYLAQSSDRIPSQPNKHVEAKDDFDKKVTKLLEEQ